MVGASEISAESIDEHVVDCVVRATASEQKISLLASLSEVPTTLDDLMDKHIKLTGHARRSYFLGTINQELRHLPPETLEQFPDRAEPDAKTQRSKFGTQCLSAGGLLLQNVVMPSKKISLAHIYARPDNRGGAPHEKGQLSGQWRVFKLLQTLITSPVTPGDMQDIYAEHEAPVTRTGVMKIIRRLSKVGIVAHMGWDSRSKQWGLTDEGYALSQPIVEIISGTAHHDQEMYQAGLKAIKRYTDPSGSNRSCVPFLIKRAKLAYGLNNSRLDEINTSLEAIARENGGTVAISTVDLVNRLSDSSVTHTQLMRVLEELPGSVIRNVIPGKSNKGGNTWELQARTPSVHYKNI